MVFKPFRPPLLKKPTNIPNQADEPPVKKRRITPENEDGAPNEEVLAPIISSFASSLSHGHDSQRRKLHSTSTLPASDVSSASSRPGSTAEGYFNVLWRKFTNKMNKTWDGDGILVVRNGFAQLLDLSGKDMGRTKCDNLPKQGAMLSMSGKEVEIDSQMTEEEFMSTTAATKSGRSAPKPVAAKIQTSLARPLIPPVSSPPTASAAVPQRKAAYKIATTPSYDLQKEYRNPLMDKSALGSGRDKAPQARHDPHGPNALVMKRPVQVPSGKHVVDVVVDPILSQKLRPHQRDGVQFMYECVMGMRGVGEGVILADDMGLGKTLQVVTLLWTLLKQSPIHGEAGVIKKALIVCPATLVRNWKNEFRKWLQKDKIGIFMAEDKDNSIRHFFSGRAYQVCIMSYERLQRVHEELQRYGTIDMIIADEGHRLKTASNKCGQIIKSFDTQKRVLLTGTPLQNELLEFYHVLDLVNPGQLGKPGVFKRNYEQPIVRGRLEHATEDEVAHGQAQSDALMELTSAFMLRRDASILANFLPPKSEHVVFCQPTAAQAQLYKNVLQSQAFTSVLGSSQAALQLITVLKKVCNSPTLLRDRSVVDDGEKTNDLVASIVADLPAGLLKSPASSAKFKTLDTLLHKIRSTTEDKVVLVSHYTQTLDILEKLCGSLGYSSLRLDGSTAQTKRQGLVNKFNSSDANGCFVFLLSAKSGGAGLNLIGACRLILFDVDWNPSTDAQAMARIHRDGQRKHCHIYRLMTQGALDEKIYQRQLTKQALADSVVDNRISTSNFSQEELRRLFSLDERDDCQTHELLGCTCAGQGTDVSGQAIPTSGDATPTLVESPTKPSGFVPSSQIDFDERNRLDEKKRSEKAQMATLMRYRHVNALAFRSGDYPKAIAPTIVPDDVSDSEDFDDINEVLNSALRRARKRHETVDDILHDDILSSVVKEQDSRVSFIFSRTAGGDEFMEPVQIQRGLDGFATKKKKRLIR